MKTRILLALLMFTGLFFLSSCESTGKNTGSTTNAAAIRTQNQLENKQLTDAEKKALIEADLWLPANQKPAATK